MKKICLKCKKKKEETLFYKNNKSKDNLRDRCIECCKEDNKDKNKKNKLRVIRHYSNGSFSCSCCLENKIEFLTVDHIDNNGAELRKKDSAHCKIYSWILKNNFPPGFRILCMNCNLSIGVWGYCPHNGISHFDKDIYDRLDEPPRVYGIHNSAAKLVDQNIKDCRKLFKAGKSINELASQFGTGRSTIRDIINYRTWKHI